MAREGRKQQKPHLYADLAGWVCIGAGGVKGYGSTASAAFTMCRFEERQAKALALKRNRTPESRAKDRLQVLG